MKYYFTLGIFALILAACSAHITPVNEIKPIKTTVCPDISCFKERLLANGSATPAAIAAFFGRVSYQDNIIRIMEKPGTANPWYVFQKNHVSAVMIARGIDFYHQNSRVLQELAAATGVPPEYLVAIIAVETHYGDLMGNNQVADALYTLAFFYPRRAWFYQNELENFFLMAAEADKDPFSYRGSFAGAMGYPQFMPSSYRKWAVSFNHGGRADIWHNAADALASVANYLQQHGWQKNKRVLAAADLVIPYELASELENNAELQYTVKELRALGVTFDTVSDDEDPVLLFRLETAPGVWRIYAGLNNFRVIWHYNHSRMYVMAVEEMATKIRSGL